MYYAVIFLLSRYLGTNVQYGTLVLINKYF